MSSRSLYDPGNIFTAGGTSGADLKRLVMQLVFRHAGSPRSIVDVGAGKGELLARLCNTYPDAELAGMDALAKPEGLQHLDWLVVDLNEPPTRENEYDLVVCSEVIEHVENPRRLFRYLSSLLQLNGTLILTTPNQSSLRSLLSLLVYGHFVAFRDDCYPAHISSLLPKDLRRMVDENALKFVEIAFTHSGRLPSFPRLTWQQMSCGMLRGRAFSDNVAVVVRKPDPSSTPPSSSARATR